jgi:hypothetical protein
MVVELLIVELFFDYGRWPVTMAASSEEETSTLG